MAYLTIGDIYPPIISVGTTSKLEVGRIMLGNTQIYPKPFGRGKLYNNYCLANLPKAGWRVPTNADFNTLLAYMFDQGYGQSLVLAEYFEPLTTATNASGFTAIAAGGLDNVAGDFVQSFAKCFMWVSNYGGSPVRPYAISISPTANVIGNASNLTDYNDGCSVRFIKTDSNYTNFYTDNVGNKYRTAKIGNQVWMIENLKDTKLNTGVNIPIATTPIMWVGAITPLCASLNFNSAND